MDSPATVVDELDRRMLLALIAQPLAPFSQIAERLGASTATVATRYRRLKRQGLIRITGRTLPGFGGRHVYLIRAGSRPDHIAHLATSVATYDNSRWVRISKDGTELMCGLVTDSPADDPILTLLPSESLRSLELHELLHVWGLESSLTTGSPGTVDPLDEALITRLAVDGRARLRELARELGVNASTVSRRRRRLIDSGVLYFEADVHPDALDGSGDAMVWMSLPPGRIRSAGQKLRADSRVRFTAATSGTSDLVAHVHVMDNQELLAFVDETLAELAIASAQVVPMGRVLKRNAV